jgi:putative ABC transport system permease protein
LFRSALMTFQFTLSIVMIIAVIVNFRQMRYTQNADLGFDKKQIVTVVTPTNFKNEFLLRRVFKERLLQHAGIERVTYSYGNPGECVGDMPLREINGMKRSAKAIYIDNDYTSVMGITFSDGRNFSPETAYDSIGASRTPDGDVILVNESLVREFGLVHPVGQVIYQQLDRNANLIVGVVKDFHFRSFHEKIEPMILMRLDQPGNVASMKISSSNIQQTIGDIETEWKRVWSDAPIPFAYKFLDDTFNHQYTKDVQLATSIGYFTGLAVVIACLGLFALSSYVVSRRTKEIGVRKTLGASFLRIYWMLAWDFLKWILLAALIACPVAWFIMQRWLETFAYHVSIEMDVFIMAAMLSVVIALVTFAWQSLKAARANPVKSLRYE